ncbi:MAG: hypothetical protein GX100_11040 [candidate division WS1 bacterium]|nr:hypothetical protein [candidate division WS1 bacterium]
MPINLWGFNQTGLGSRDASWQPVHELVVRYGLEGHVAWSGERTACGGVQTYTRETGDPDRYEEVMTLATPAGDLQSVYSCSRSGKPGYTVKYLVTSVEEAGRWLSLPDPDLPSVGGFHERERQVGERALLCIAVGDWASPMQMVNEAVGSELWAYWLHDERELLHEMVGKTFRRILRELQHYLAHGVGPLYGWGGPELCLPPLASVHDFEDFVVRYDQPLIEAVHEGGGVVWVHCHGDMAPVLQHFLDMGVDCLNPIEPPPMGKLTLAEVKEHVAGQMTLEGGVESSALDLLSPAAMAEVVAETVAMGKPGGRFILGPTSSPAPWPVMLPHLYENYRVLVETGLALGAYP